jgi:hypothetical protein
MKIAGRTGRKAGDDLVLGLRFHFLLSVLSDNLVIRGCIVLIKQNRFAMMRSTLMSH